MKHNTLPVSEGLRPLFLAIARASVASAMAGCVAEHLELDDDAETDAALDGGASVQEAGSYPPDAPGGDPASEPDAAPPRDAGGEPVIGPGDGGVGDGWERVKCAADIVRVDPAETTLLMDAVSVYVDARFNDGSRIDPDARGTYELARAGDTCSGAGDRASCEQQVATLTTSESCAADKCYFAIAGGGDMYTRLRTRAELVALLGSIDDAADALLVAAFDGHALCAGLQTDPRDIGSEVRALDKGGFELRITREQCGGSLYRDHLTVAADGTLKLVSHVELAPSTCAIGRRPAGLRAAGARAGRTRIGAFLAQAAHLEAASVYAFYKLLRELRALGAPEELRTAALDAMLDEVRHAQEVGELARAFGGELTRPEIEATGLGSAFDLAIENIGEGCVRETFGALQATYQAETAADPRVRSVMGRIAEDESRHADLAWRLHAWLEPKLSERERAQVGAERTRVLDALAADLDVGLSREEHAELGFPMPEVSADMLRSLSQSLFA